MEPDKSLQEALFRSHQATEKSNQEQSKLYNMAGDSQSNEPQKADMPQPELHETPRNLLQSWDTLRQMDEELEAKKAKNKRKTDHGSKV